QKCDRGSVEKTFSDYTAQFAYRKARFSLSEPQPSVAATAAVIQEDSRVFLLLRVLFDIPENERLRVKFYPWLAPSGEARASWPVTWQAGRPHLLSGSTGIQGVVDLYDAAAEYRDFERCYPFRVFTDSPPATKNTNSP